MSAFRRGACALIALALVGCGDFTAQEVDGPEPDGPPIRKLSFAITVEQAINADCSTTSVKGLSEQIVEQMNCIIPNALAPVPDRPNLTKSAATFAFMQPPARDALVDALDTNPNKTLGINSMLRTVAQQYLLYRWAQSSSCGIGLAATPGNSNHESGLALDTSQYASWQTALEARGFEWFGSADKVHFDYRGAGVVDLKGKDVLAFQMLWNLNNPSDAIAEDGDYGPQTAARLSEAPAEGFAVGPMCAPPGSGGAGGAPGSGGATGAGGAGGAPGVGGSGGAGEPGVGGAGGAGGVSGTGGTPTGAGGTGQESGGSSGLGGPVPGCSVAPDCSACIGCMERCVCETGDAYSCAGICAPMDDPGAEAPPGDDSPRPPVRHAPANGGGCSAAAAGKSAPGRGAGWLALAVLFPLYRRRFGTPRPATKG